MVATFIQLLESFLKSFWALGAFGALLALRGVVELTWLGKFYHVLGGVLIAGLLTDGVAEYYSLTAGALPKAIAFLLGMFGMNLLVAVLRFIREAKLSDVIPWRKKE